VRNRLPDERVGVRHSAAILVCVLQISQRIAVIWQTKNKVLGNALTSQLIRARELTDYRSYGRPKLPLGC